ncbi:MAG: hypothetical protein ABI680_07445, partial [Chthoniobacteraceae bacterium]
AGRWAESAKLREETVVVARKLHPEHADTDQEVLDLANAYHEDGRTEEALPLWAEVSARRQSDWRLFQRVTGLQAWFRKDAEHASACRQMFETVRDTSDPSTAERAAKAYCLRKSSDPKLLGKNEDYLDTCKRALTNAESNGIDPIRAQLIAAKIVCLRMHADSEVRNQALTLARRAATARNAPRALSQFTLGLAEFRCGNDTAAEKALAIAEERRAEEPTFFPGAVRLYRAMILMNRGRRAEALALFAQAKALMKPFPWERHGVIPRGVSAGDLQFRIAYEEAKALIQPEK